MDRSYTIECQKEKLLDHLLVPSSHCRQNVYHHEIIHCSPKIEGHCWDPLLQLLLRNWEIKAHGQSMQSHAICTRNSICSRRNTHFPNKINFLKKFATTSHGYPAIKFKTKCITGRPSTFRTPSSYSWVSAYRFSSQILSKDGASRSNGLGASIWIVCEPAKSDLRTICQLDNTFSSRRSS